MCNVHRSLNHAFITLLCALVISKVDYCNSVLAGVSWNLISRFQSVLNAAAHLIFAGCKTDQITPLWKNFTGWRCQKELGFTCVCWHTTASMDDGTAYTRVLSFSAYDALDLLVPVTRCRILGDRSFSVAVTLAWNTLVSFIKLFFFA